MSNKLSRWGISVFLLLLLTACPQTEKDLRGFSLTLSDASLELVRGGEAEVQVNIQASNGFDGEVTLSVTGLPEGIEGGFDPNPTGVSSTLTLSATDTAELGKVTLTVKGVSGTLEHTAQLELTVTQSSGGGTNEGITDYLVVNDTPAIKLGNGQIVLLDRLDEWEAVLEQFPPPDESAPQSLEPLQSLPARVDLRANQTPIRNQEGRGTCTTFASVAAIEAAYRRERGLTLDLSEQYANHIAKTTALPQANQTIFERETGVGAWGGGGVGYSLGWLFRLRFGVPEESVMAGSVASHPTMTYIPWTDYENMDQVGDAPRFDLAERLVTQDEFDFWNLNHEPTAFRIPAAETLTNLPRTAVENAVYGVRRVRGKWAHRDGPITLDELRAELAAGREIAFGVNLSRPNPCQVCDEDGCEPLPEGDDCYQTQRREIDEQFIGGVWRPLPTDWGGHAMLMVGYDDSRRVFIVKNSWGRDGSGRGQPIEADRDADGFIEMSYDWLPRILEASWVLETRAISSWRDTNQQVLLGRWRAEFDNFVHRADLAAYHIPDAFPASSLSGQTDRRIGTLYSYDAGAFRINGQFIVSPDRREMNAFFGTNAINDTYNTTAGGHEIDAYVFSNDDKTMAGWVTDPRDSDLQTPFYASLNDYPAMTAARASASSVAAEDYLGRWQLSDDGVEGALDLKGVTGSHTVWGSYLLGATEVVGVLLTIDSANPCRFTLEIPFATYIESFTGGLYCQTPAPSKRALMAGTSSQGGFTRGFYAYRTGDIPISIEIITPVHGRSYSRGSARVDFLAEAVTFDTVVWTSSLDGNIGTGLSFARFDLSLGVHEITATASNAEGDSASDSVSITIINDPPTVEILEPTGTGDPFCVGEPVTFRAIVTDLNTPGRTLPDDSVTWRTATGDDMGTGKEIVYTFEVAGGYNVVARATDEEGAFDEASVNVAVVECSDSPPTVTITTPAEDTGTDDPEYVYDGYDDALDMWYTDVLLEGEATDPEDGALTGDSLKWTTNRTDLQAADLGTGESLTVRLYSNECFGVWHEITLSATDSDRNTRPAVRRIFIWTLC